jgi:hypothetical protein
VHEGHHHRDGIPRQPRESRAAHLAERDRPARLDRKPPEEQRPRRLDRRLHVVLLAGRDATRGQQQVVRGRSLGKRGGHGVSAIRQDAEIGDRAAETRQRRVQREAVAVIDLQRRKGRAGRSELVAGREQRDAQPRAHGEAVPPKRRRQADILRAQQTPGRQGERAPRHVLARRARIRPALEPRAQPHAAVGQRLGILLHHHRVRTLGHRRAGEDADRLARADRTAERLTGGHTGTDGEDRVPIGREIGVAHGVAVHGAVGEGRQIGRGDQVLGEDAPDRLMQRRAFDGRDRAEPCTQLGKRVVHRHERAAEGETVVRELRHAISPRRARARRSRPRG